MTGPARDRSMETSLLLVFIFSLSYSGKTRSSLSKPLPDNTQKASLLATE